MCDRKDANEIFHEPVDPEEVPLYASIIKNPMDFATMLAKLESDKYTEVRCPLSSHLI